MFSLSTKINRAFHLSSKFLFICFSSYCRIKVRIKCDNKTFTLLALPLSSAYTNNLACGIEKTRVNCFAIDIHKYLRYMDSHRVLKVVL